MRWSLVAAGRGWGVRCGAPIAQGQVVVEVRGRCLSEAEYEELADPSCAHDARTPRTYTWQDAAELAA